MDESITARPEIPAPYYYAPSAAIYEDRAGMRYKIRITIYAVIAFFVLGQPLAYKGLDQLFGIITKRYNEIIDSYTEKASIKGMVLMSLIFGIIVWIMLW